MNELLLLLPKVKHHILNWIVRFRGQRLIPVDLQHWLVGYLNCVLNFLLLFFSYDDFPLIFRPILSLNYPCTRWVSQPSPSQRNFSCAEGRRWRRQPSLATERGLWVPLTRAGCHRLAPGLCLLAALEPAGVRVSVCLGGYLFRRMPPIWGLTAVLSESFSQLPLGWGESAAPLSRGDTGESGSRLAWGSIWRSTTPVLRLRHCTVFV